MAKAQYLYSDGKPVVTEEGYNIHKMNPPFAGNLILASGSTMTMANYCGRYAEQQIEDGTHVNCVYSSAFINYYYKTEGHLTASSEFTEVSALRHTENT